MLGDRFNMSETLAAMRQARKEQRAVHSLFATFDWDSEIQTTVGAESGTRIRVRDVVELPEFRERLGNILSKSGKHKCFVYPIVRDLKVLKDDDVMYDTAMVSVVFEPWVETDTMASGACILRGNKSDAQHVRNKWGVCWYCGAA